MPGDKKVSPTPSSSDARSDSTGKSSNTSNYNPANVIRWRQGVERAGQSSSRPVETSQTPGTHPGGDGQNAKGKGRPDVSQSIAETRANLAARVASLKRAETSQTPGTHSGGDGQNAAGKEKEKVTSDSHHDRTDYLTGSLRAERPDYLTGSPPRSETSDGPIVLKPQYETGLGSKDKRPNTSNDNTSNDNYSKVDKWLEGVIRANQFPSRSVETSQTPGTHSGGDGQKGRVDLKKNQQDVLPLVNRFGPERLNAILQSPFIPKPKSNADAINAASSSGSPSGSGDLPGTTQVDVNKKTEGSQSQNLAKDSTGNSSDTGGDSPDVKGKGKQVDSPDVKGKGKQVMPEEDMRSQLSKSIAATLSRSASDVGYTSFPKFSSDSDDSRHSRHSSDTEHQYYHGLASKSTLGLLSPSERVGDPSNNYEPRPESPVNNARVLSASPEPIGRASSPRNSDRLSNRSASTASSERTLVNE